MGTFMPADKTSVTTPALTDIHVISQAGVLKGETNTQILSLITPTNINPIGLQWQLDTNTWTYSSADANAAIYVFNINADATGYMFVGQKVKYTQTTTKYGIIVAVGAFTGALTPITIYGGGTAAAPSYALANAAITSPYFATTERPFGFPMGVSTWSTEIISTSHCYVGSGLGIAENDWYGGDVAWASGANITGYIGIGLWDLEFFANRYLLMSSTHASNQWITLSTTNSGASDSYFSIESHETGTSFENCYKRKNVLLAATTQYWVLGFIDDLYAVTSFGIYGPGSPTIVRARCLYL